MSETAAHLVDHVIPHGPVRQWVLSLPMPLRVLLAAQPEWVTPMLEVAQREVTRHLQADSQLKSDEGQGGADRKVQDFARRNAKKFRWSQSLVRRIFQPTDSWWRPGEFVVLKLRRRRRHVRGGMDSSPASPRDGRRVRQSGFRQGTGLGAMLVFPLSDVHNLRRPLMRSWYLLHIVRIVGVAALFGALHGVAFAQDAFPTKPVRLVLCCVGAMEAVTRATAEEMAKDLGQPVLVEAKPGAAGGIGADFVAKSRNDGYTVLVGTNATHAANQSLYLNLPYDFVKDFSPVGGIGAGTMVLLVSADSPLRSVADLTARARQNPGKLTYAWAGTTPRVAMELYSQLANVRLLEVPYKTNPQAVTDLLGGQFDTMVADLNTSAPLVKAGRLRALAVTGPRRAEVLPEVPTMHEAGVPGYSLTWWFGMWAPAGTPRPVVERLNAALAKAIAAPRMAEYFRNTGAEPMPLTPDELMKFQVSENKKWAVIVSKAGIKPQ